MGMGEAVRAKVRLASTEVNAPLATRLLAISLQATLEDSRRIFSDSIEPDRQGRVDGMFIDSEKLDAQGLYYQDRVTLVTLEGENKDMT